MISNIIYENINFPSLITSQIIFSQAGFLKLGNDINGEAVGDESGISVVINSSGNRIAIGGYKNDGNGSNSGNVRIYEDIGGNCIQMGSDIDGETTSDKFGKSVDMNSAGDRVVVGAWFASSGVLPIGSGQISCYQFTNGTWNQLGNKLTSFENNTISLKGFGNGIYLLKIYFGEKIQEIKVVKKE